MGDECRIRVLSDLLIKKIAAGEVVERPASVVKELVENAIDATAGRISVTVEQGGKQLIRVTDDGCGLTSEELHLAVTQHATSKIASEDDLNAISTMGFRGEALASISSISKLRIVSRRADEPEGHEIRVAAQHVESSGVAGCPVGTTVEVRDLFFNVPVRRKFLRADSTENGHINEQLARVALVNPAIAFELTSNGRVKRSLPTCRDLLERVGKFYGPELAESLLPIHRNERGVDLEIYVAPPAQARASAQWQYTFVNNRYIRDRYIQHAIKEAHRGLVEPNRHGVAFVFLNVAPDKVDVNVHPTKIEVRWADPNLIHSQVLSALRETFQRADLTPALRTNRMHEPASSSAQDRIRQDMAALLKSTPPIQPIGGDRMRSPGGYGVGSESGGHRNQPQAHGSPPRSMDGARVWESLYAKPQGAGSTGVSDSETEVPSAALVDGNATAPRAVQMHNLYLVAETEDGIVIVDQHALHERILYEQFRQRVASGELESQRLLLPETLSVTPSQLALVESHGDLLTKLGLDVAAFGADTLAVHGFPVLLKDTNVASFMRDLLDYLAGDTPEASGENVLEHVLSMMACKAAIKAGDPLSPEEIQELFKRRHLIDKSSSCPHGRPTMLSLSRADLDRQFHRT